MSEQSENDPLEEILIALRDEQKAVREGAISRLQGYAWSTSNIANVGKLSDDEIMKAMHENKIRVLQQIRVVDALLAAIDDSSIRVRSAAALLLGSATDLRAQEALIRHLRDDPSAHARRMCAAGLGWTPASSQKVDAFIAALKDLDYGVVMTSCISLGKAGDKRAAEPLRAAMAHLAWNVRFYACNALVKLGAIDRAAVRCLERLDQAPEARGHNEMVNEPSDQAEADEPKKDRQALTTTCVLEQARRLLP